MELKQWIAIDTQNPGTDYRKMTARLSMELKKRGAVVKMAGKNILGIWGRPRLLLNAHIDTVKAVGWATDPLRARVHATKTIGLGACDNKGNIYCIFKAIDGAEGRVRNLMVLFSVDEEFGHVSRIHDFAKSGYARGIRRVIVLEPTENRVIRKHPGYYSFWLTFNAKQGHSSALKENAIVKAARAICRLKGFNIGSIESTNQAGNVSAGQCRVKISIRTFERYPNVLRKVKRVAKGASVERSFVGRPFDNRKPFLRGARNEVSFWSEAAVFSGYGFNTVLYGAGSIRQAHAPGEYVRHQSLKKCVGFLRSAIGEWA